MVTRVPLGLCVVDGKGMVLEANAALARLLGAGSVDEIRGTLAARYHAHPVIALDLLRERLEDGPATDLEMELVRVDGSSFTARIHADLVRDGDGELCVVGSVEDVTAHRHDQSASRHTEKMEAVSRFAAGMAQEYNNLLTTILGEARGLLEAAEAQEETRALRTVVRTARKAATLTRRLLVFSSSEVSQTRVLHLSEAVSDFRVAEREACREEDDLSLVWRLDPEAGRVRIDPQHLHTILENLLLNARDALPAGGRVVVETGRLQAPEDTDGIHFHPSVPAGAYACLSVGDDGVGMNRDTRQRVFDPFFTTKSLGTALGLGLTTVYGHVLRARGHVSVISAPAYGTLVRVLLPVTDEPVSQVPLPPRDARGATDPGASVLVVDDDAGVRAVMKRIVERMGLAVEVAPDGVAARKMLRESARPDLLLTDVMMPRLKGTELARWFMSERPEAAVLLVSGYTDSAELQAWVDEDQEIFLAKPFEPKELMERVRRRLGLPAPS